MRGNILFKIFDWSCEWIAFLPLKLREGKDLQFEFALACIPWLMLTLPIMAPFVLIGLAGIAWDVINLSEKQ